MLLPIIAKEPSSSCPSLDTILLPECGMTKLNVRMKHDTCAVRKRLLPYIDYLRGKERPCSTITENVIRRYNYFHDTVTYKIRTDHMQWIGDSAAPIAMVIYVSMQCPHCKQLYGQLYDTLMANKRLHRTMKIGLKNLSLTKYDHMFVASAQLGKQPAFLRTFAKISERASDPAMRRVCDSIGVSVGSLEKLADSVTIARIANSSREEAIRNKVTGTPAIFINNQRYSSSKDVLWILEAVENLHPKR